MRDIQLDVIDCPACGGGHAGVEFAWHPGLGPTELHSHKATCPRTGATFWMEVGLAEYEWLCREAGVPCER